MKRWMLILLLVIAGCGRVEQSGQDSGSMGYDQEQGAAAETPAVNSTPLAAESTPSAGAAASPTAQPTAERAASGPSSGFRTWDEAPAMSIDPAKAYTATITTEKGDIVIQLLAQQAPQTVNNFVFLSQQGYYDGSTFHRVLPGFVAQGGDPTGTGAGGPGYTIPDELASPMTFDRAGLVAMAKTAQPNSAGSQFFITLGAAPHLSDQYTIFGEVLEGMDVVQELTPRDPDSGQAVSPGDQILTITIEEG